MTREPVEVEHLGAVAHREVHGRQGRAVEVVEVRRRPAAAARSAPGRAGRGPTAGGRRRTPPSACGSARPSRPARRRAGARSAAGGPPARRARDSDRLRCSSSNAPSSASDARGDAHARGRAVACHAASLPPSGRSGASPPEPPTLLTTVDGRDPEPGGDQRRDRGDRRGVRARGRAETQPRLDYPPYRSSLLRHPTKDLHHADPEGVELCAPVFGQRDVDAARGRPDHPAPRRADRRAIVVTGRVLDGDGRPVARPAGRDLAGQRRRPLHPPARPAPGADRPELHRRRPLPDRRRTAPTASPPSSPGRTRGATTTTPGGRRTSTSRCSAPTSPSGWSPRCTSPATRCSPLDPIYQVDRRPAGPRAAGRDATTTTSPSPSGAPATAGTSCSPAATGTWTDGGVTHA